MALGRLKKARTAITSAPKAAKQFGKTLVSEGKKDVARRGSPAQRFADAPLGQYYLPKAARTALGFAAPSPRKVGRDVRNVARRPGLGTGAAAAGDTLAIATLPALVSGAGRLAARGGPKAAMALRGGEAGKLSKFPTRGSMVDRIRAQVFNKIKSGQGENRTQFLNRRISEIRAEIDKIDAGSRVKPPSSLRNLSNIRDKAVPKGKALPPGLKGGEGGFLRLPGGEGPQGARETVRRANLRATRSVLKHNISTAKSMLSMETSGNLEALGNLVTKAPQAGPKSMTIAGMESRLPTKTVGHLVRKEKVMRAAMRKVGMDPGKVVRGQGSIIEIEGRMPLTAALKRLGETDRWSPEKVEGLLKMKIHPKRFPRN